MADDSLRIQLEAIDKSLTRVVGLAEKSLQKLEKQSTKTATKTDKAFIKMGNSAQRAGRLITGGVKRVVRSLTSLQGMLVGGGIIVGFQKMVKSAVDFETGLAEVSTLLDGPAKQAMKGYESALKSMVKTSSRSLNDLTKGLYQTISSGVTDQEKAIELLNEAQKASVAGLTSVSTAVDAGTTLVNAYQLETHEVSKAFDILFQTVRRGKTCVTGDTRVLLSDGRYRRIDSLRGTNTIVAWDGRAFTPAESQWIEIGDRETVILETRGGRKITTTPDHPYLTKDGWREVTELKAGDAIAVPVSLPFFGSVVPDDGWPTLLGYLISEGSLRDGSSPAVHNNNADVIAECEDAVKKLGLKLHGYNVSDGGCISCHIVANPRGGRTKNPAIEKLREWGLWGTTCGNKFIPEECFTWKREHVAELLRTLFNGDGWLCDVKQGNRDRGTSLFQLGYGSKSERLVRDISHLLTRFGIYGSVRVKKTEKYGNHYSWMTNRYVDIRRFVEFIGIDRPAVDEVLSADTVTWTPRGFIRSKNRDSNRGNMARGMRDFKSPVFYDKIKAITRGTVERVYDLTVPILHCFVANDIVAHNTFEPLAHNIGKVATIASQAGVPLEAVGASIATITKAGLDVDLATTSLRQFFNELLKPSQESKENLDALGIATGEAALRGENYAKTIEKLNKVTGGSPEVLTKLFGNIRALQAAMILSGKQIVTFREDLDKMNESAGVSAEAFKKMSETSAEKLSIQWQRLALVAQELGAKFLPEIVDTLTDIADWVEDHGEEIVEGFYQFKEAAVAVAGALATILRIGTGLRNSCGRSPPPIAEAFLPAKCNRCISSARILLPTFCTRIRSSRTERRPHFRGALAARRNRERFRRALPNSIRRTARSSATVRRQAVRVHRNTPPRFRCRRPPDTPRSRYRRAPRAFPDWLPRS